MNGGRNEIGIFIRRLREEKGVTQKDLSARLETREVYLSASSIGKIEHGARPITDIQIIAIAKALQVKPELFFTMLSEEK